MLQKKKLMILERRNMLEGIIQCLMILSGQRLDKKERNLLRTNVKKRIVETEKTVELTAHLKFMAGTAAISVALIRIQSSRFLRNTAQGEAYPLQTVAEEQATRVEEALPHLVNRTKPRRTTYQDQ